MTALTFNNSNHKILIVGPVYDRLDKLKNAASLIDKYDFIIFNGNLCYPHDNLFLVQDRIDIMNYLISTKKVIYNLGNYDYQLINELSPDANPYIRNWLESKPNVVIFNFISQTSLIITCGGVLPKISKKDLNDNLEVSFISKIDKKPWQEFYGGGYGYIVSNNPLTSNPPEFYNFSAQIGNVYSPNVNVFAQEADQFGLKKTILL